MMTNEELIIGHYEHSLTPDQEQLLRQRIGESPETRAMYDQYGQHGNLDAALAADATALQPSSRLDEATVAAALGIIPEVIGGGSIFSWLTGKVAVGITAVVVGAVSITLFSDIGSDSTPKPVPAVQQTAPAGSSTEAPRTVTPAVPSTVTSSTEAPAVDNTTRTTAPAEAPASERTTRRNTTASSQKRTASSRGNTKPSTLTIDSQNSPTLQGGTKVQPEGNK